MRKKIVIIGGSFGGINVAYALRRALGSAADITVISKDAAFTFLPSLPWAILGWRDPARLQVPLQQTLARRGIHFVEAEVTSVDPARGEVRTAVSTFPYDILAIASGGDLDYAAVPGLGPVQGHTQSTFSADEAGRAREALARVLAGDRGEIVIGAAPGASCIGPAYELVMMIDTALKRARKRPGFHLTLVTPEPFVGHFGVGGIGMAPRLIEDELADRDIETIVSARLSAAHPDRLVIADRGDVPFDFALIIPAFVGSGFVRAVEGLANARGFVTVTNELTSTQFSNIYAVGVAIAIAPPGPTPVPVAVPKTGHMTELMAHAAAHNIAAELKGGNKVDGLRLPSTCIADAGDTAFYFHADPFLPPRNRIVHKQGRWAHYLKVAFEQFYLARIRHDWPSLNFGW
ncbi:FAD-dependent oxidoreductase [Candidatus Binatia bacterium]|nr:FAD-dependent oxidoreductase [Candidatus Binatia bacterium]